LSLRTRLTTSDIDSRGGDRENQVAQRELNEGVRFTMPLETPPIKKKAERGRVELHKTIYRIDIGHTDIPDIGTDVGGGGTVTGTTDSSVTVGFRNPSPDGPIRVTGVRTTVVQEYTFPHEDGIATGNHIGGGGVVVNVTPTTVTIQFPDGVPDHVDLPGIETTVVDESGGTETPSAIFSPWQPDDVLIPVPAGGFSPGEGQLSVDSMHQTFRLPTPGNKANAVRMPNFLLNPTNTSSCSCVVSIASFTSSGVKVGIMVTLLPGKSIPFYQLEQGGSFVLAVCAADCTETGCVCSLTIARGEA
jgi:hypothetical protein